jgi:hypothetical protein
VEGGGLSFFRADGSRIAFNNPARIWCGPWTDIVKTRSLHVATLPGKRAEAWWEVKAVIAAVRRQPRVGFPVNFVWNRPTGAQVFAADDRGNGNEASTEQEDSSGSMRFEDASCQRGARVEFSIDAVLDSEFSDDTPITVRGQFRGTVGAPPAGFTRR